MQTGEMLEKIERVLITEQPDLVIVFGDTNSTLAGALAAAKLHIPVAYVEAGLRSFDRSMPEEINRIITDHISDLLFCPTQTSVDNLAQEGVTKGVFLVGDVMVDALEYNRIIAEEKSGVIERFGLNNNYMVLTVHRPANTDSRKNMVAIISAIRESGNKTIFPVHPRTRKCLEKYGLWNTLPLTIITTEPLGYLDMLKLMSHADKILTDSGGIQKEAYILGVPCITLRDTTEWVETLKGGWNVLVGGDYAQIVSNIAQSHPISNSQSTIFGSGDCAKRMCNVINLRIN